MAICTRTKHSDGKVSITQKILIEPDLIAPLLEAIVALQKDLNSIPGIIGGDRKRCW